MKKLKNFFFAATELYLAFWFCFYAHDNYITLEKAKLLITSKKRQKTKRNNPKLEVEK